jgi:hypothetical protein
MPVLEFVGLWQERLAAVQAVGCSYADSTLAFKLLGEKFLKMHIRALLMGDGLRIRRTGFKASVQDSDP